MFRFSLLVVLLALAAAKADQQQIKCPQSGLHLYPDENNCNKYYECYYGQLNNITCEKDYLYNEVYRWCDFPDHVECGSRLVCEGDGTDCYEHHIDNNIPTSSPDDGFDCPEPQGFFADDKNCAKYWQCSNNVAIHHTCDTKGGIQLLYRPSNIQCDYPERVDCGNRPICEDVENDENCNRHTTTPKPITPCDGIPCDHGDGFYPEGDCVQCFCRCSGGVHYETCCQPGLFFNPAIEECDWPYNINGCP